MPQRLLIIKPSALGDVATTLPLLCDLHAALPDAHIDWLIHPAYAPILEGHDALHALIPFDRKNLAPWWYKPAATRRFTGLLKTLRDHHYDIVIDAQGLFRSAFLTRITGAKIRIGFAHAREGAPLAYTHKIKLPHKGKKMLAVDRMRALGQSLHTNPSTPAQFRLPLTPEALASATTLLTQNSQLDTHHSSLITHHFVAVIPGARWNTKRWPLDRYTQVVQNLLDAGHHVVLLGSPEEKPLCDQIYSSLITHYSSLKPQNSELRTQNSELRTLNSELRTLNSELLNLAGLTPLPTLLALLARAKLVLANDSGPLHLAAALGTPVVALYGPTSPDHVGPYLQPQNVLRHDVPCHPCRLRECDHHSCMQGLSVELVWEHTSRQLDKTIG